MSHRLIVEAGAEDGIDVAYRWYEAGIRRALPHVFPYLVFFTLHGQTVHVLAIVHAAQNPAYIAGRLGA